MCVGPIMGDSILEVKMGDKLKISNDGNKTGMSGLIYLVNCRKFTKDMVG